MITWSNRHVELNQSKQKMEQQTHAVWNRNAVIWIFISGLDDFFQVLQHVIYCRPKYAIWGRWRGYSSWEITGQRWMSPSLGDSPKTYIQYITLYIYIYIYLLIPHYIYIHICTCIYISLSLHLQSSQFVVGSSWVANHSQGPGQWSYMAHGYSKPSIRIVLDPPLDGLLGENSVLAACGCEYSQNHGATFQSKQYQPFSAVLEWFSLA